MEIIGFIASLFIGIALGLIGGGGSILTVPVLTYFFQVDPVTATGYSLFIVGLTSLIGSISFFRRGLVNLRIALIFGIPAIVAVFLTRYFIVPAIPQQLFRFGDFVLTKPIFIMVFFALLMIAASVGMIRNKTVTEESTKGSDLKYGLILAEGVLVGVLTGLVGAGGGFLIIPALVLLGKLPIKEAIGTSLLIIGSKSLIGFLGEGNLANMDWSLLTTVSVLAIVGIFIGAMLSKKISGAQLKPAFGWFVLVMGIYIIVREIMVSFT